MAMPGISSSKNGCFGCPRPSPSSFIFIIILRPLHHPSSSCLSFCFLLFLLFPRCGFVPPTSCLSLLLPAPRFLSVLLHAQGKSELRHTVFAPTIFTPFFCLSRDQGVTPTSFLPTDCAQASFCVNQFLDKLVFAQIIHPASRGVAAHTAGLFRSVRGAKGGFPPWGLPKLRIFTFPPRGGSPS